MSREDLALKGKYPPYPAEPISDIRDMFLKSVEKHGRRTALQYKKGGRWIPITFAELYSMVEQAACGLAVLGLNPVEDKLAIVGDNRPEWAVSYLAAACTGVVCIPVDRDLRETEIYHILYLSGAKVLVGDARHIEMVQEIQDKLPNLKTLISMDEPDTNGCVTGFEQLKALGKARIEHAENDFLERRVTPDHLLSILFTSGTMGNSKGVMLTHRNAASNMQDAVSWVNLTSEDRFLSVLPMHHSYECTLGFLLPIYQGALISYAENLRRIAENLVETRSTAMLGVPALWHAIYKKIEAGMAQKGVWKVNAAKRIAGLSEKMLGRNIRRRVFSKVHEAFGGNLRILISGGAAIDPRVARGFRELGLTFLQGYGLTEAAPLIAVNRDHAFQDDAVGLPLPSVEIKIAEDGEILAKGPNVMLGYYNNPKGTDEALEGGWLHTGDLGYVDPDGFLHIQGRKKSVIVTSGGKKIYPEEVEAELMKSPYIFECLVSGDTDQAPNDDVEIQAIVVPNTEYFISQGLENRGAMANAQVERILQQQVKQRCLRLAPYKRVTKLVVRYEEFEKTTTKKVKRFLYTGKAAKV